MKKQTAMLSLVLLLVPFLSKADIWLPSVLSDNMVLQQNTTVKLWGRADSGEKISITTSWGEQAEITANSKGKWLLEIATPKGNYVPQAIILKGKNEVYLRNILIGEVWLCSGQSNMGTPVSRAKNSYQEIQSAKYPNMRFIKVPPTLAWSPADDVAARWEACSPETVPNLSAVAYYYGKELHQNLDVPIGLIVAQWGGSDILAWMSKDGAAKQDLQQVIDWHDKYAQSIQAKRLKQIKNTVAWRARQPANGAMDISTRPKQSVPRDNHTPFGLYNGMINPIKNFTIKGVIWYQGERNVSRAHHYRKLLPALINNWRDEKRQGNFSFYFVQLSPYHYNDYEGVASAELRDAQLKTVELVENTGIVVTIDIGDVQDIHPSNKQEVGRRLSLLALHNDYKRIAKGYSSPLYKTSEIAGKNVLISFHHAEKLSIRGKEVVGVTIAGKDQKFVKAKAKIVNGNQLEVWADEIKKPMAVRFGWSNALITNLFNASGLPVSPFKTDTWNDTTEGTSQFEFPGLAPSQYK